MTDTFEIERELQEAIVGLDREAAANAASRALAAGADPQRLINEVINPTADEIGKRFDRDELFLPELLLAGAALEKAVGVLLAALPEGDQRTKKVVVIGAVKGDIHTLGKNIVATMLRTGGFTVYDLGIDVDADTFIREAIAKNADIIALSALLTTTLPYQRDLIVELDRRGLRDRFLVMVGGGAANRQWAKEIGADGYGADAVEALAVARQLCATGDTK